MPRATAASVSKNSPRSENESGVTLSTPMIIPLLERSTTLSPIFQSRSPIKNQTNMMGCLFESCLNRLFLRIAAHQFALSDDAAAHSRIHLAPLRPRLEIERPIERKDLKVIAVRSRRRLRAAITKIRIIVCPLHRSFRHAVFRDLCRFWIDIPDQPMREKSDRRVRILDNKRQTFGIRRRVFDPQFRIKVLPVLAEFYR